jgi:hypothetical protein
MCENLEKKMELNLDFIIKKKYDTNNNGLKKRKNLQQPLLKCNKLDVLSLFSVNLSSFCF